MNTIEYPTNSDTAFDHAIAEGRLSDVPSQPNYAGRYMFMGNDGTKDTFKHIDTREYLK